MWFWLKISICQSSSMVHEGSWVNCLTRVGKLEASTVCWREATRWVQLHRNQAAVDRICRVAVKGLVQEDKPKGIGQLVRFPMKLPFSVQVYTKKNNSPWSPAHMLQMMSCSAVVWSQSYIPSHSLINNVIVCNKSCYCSIINTKNLKSFIIVKAHCSMTHLKQQKSLGFF